jgi:hypothetical protein
MTQGHSPYVARGTWELEHFPIILDRNLSW